MTLPNFLIIGANRAGTTSLYHYLKQHPDIYMTPFKEPSFFVLEGMTIDSKDPFRNDVTTDLKNYLRLFEGVSGEKAIGEASTIYLHAIHKHNALSKMKQYVPHAKLIVSLRNPVERAYSHYLHDCQWGIETNQDFVSAIKKQLSGNIQDIWKNYYIAQGCYCEELKGYLRTFHPEQIRIHLFEDFKTAPLDLLQELFRFLEVDDTFVPDISRNYNVSVQEISDRSLNKELQDVFREDILRLQNLIERDLSEWLK